MCFPSNWKTFKQDYVITEQSGNAMEPIRYRTRSYFEHWCDYKTKKAPKREFSQHTRALAFFFSSLIFSITLDFQHYIRFRCTAEGLDIYTTCEVVPQSSRTHQAPSIIIEMLWTTSPMLLFTSPSLFRTCRFVFLNPIQLNSCLHSESSVMARVLGH